jgi:hypothetical protein
MPSTDEVHGLLKAVNEVTLKRMENKEDRIVEILLAMVEELNEIKSKIG